MSWITFMDAGRSASGLTKIWNVLEREGENVRLGDVRWYAPWRRYAFSPRSGTVFEQDCLRDIANFCEARTREHRARPCTEARTLDQQVIREAGT